MRGIDHPEVADLAAVSAAVARLRDSTGSAGPHLRCVQAAAKYLGNALQNPTMGKVGPAASYCVYREDWMFSCVLQPWVLSPSVSVLFSLFCAIRPCVFFLLVATLGEAE